MDVHHSCCCLFLILSVCFLVRTASKFHDGAEFIHFKPVNGNVSGSYSCFFWKISAQIRRPGHCWPNVNCEVNFKWSVSRFKTQNSWLIKPFVSVWTKRSNLTSKKTAFNLAKRMILSFLLCITCSPFGKSALCFSASHRKDVGEREERRAASTAKGEHVLTHRN